MADLIALGALWLRGIQRSHASHPVTYQSGATSLSDVPATVGRTDWEQANTEGLLTRNELRDYLIDVADLPNIVPAAGDKIIDGPATYEICNGPEGHCFRYSDPAQLRYRIHTQLI